MRMSSRTSTKQISVWLLTAIADTKRKIWIGAAGRVPRSRKHVWCLEAVHVLLYVVDVPNRKQKKVLLEIFARANRLNLTYVTYNNWMYIGIQLDFETVVLMMLTYHL